MTILNNWPYKEDDCPGHVAWSQNAKICANCGIHINSLRPDEVSPELDRELQYELEHPPKDIMRG